MKKTLILILTTVLFLSACGSEQGIEVREAWMRPAAQGENGAIYFVIHNRGSQADTLTGVSTDIAESVEMHESKMSGDVMEMQPIDSVPLEPSAEIRFEPGGRHVMLVDLKKDFKVGDEVEITLHFTKFEDINVTVPISDVPVSENHSAPNR